MKKQFKRIYVEITNVCNLNCGFCPKTSRKPQFMNEDLFRKIIGEVKNYSKYICFHVMGEPLLHPEIGLFLDICHENGCDVNLTTNATLIRKVKDKILMKPALRLMNFSLHSFNETTPHKEIDAYLDEIFNFIVEARTNPRFMACLRLWDINSDPSLSKRNEAIFRKIEKFFNLPFTIKEVPTQGNGVRLLEKLFVNQAVSFEWPNIEGDDLGEEGFCYGFRTHAAILVDGTVAPCCLDSEGIIKLGNINQSTFSEIIRSPRALRLYDGFSKRKVVESLCRKCSYRKKFDLDVEEGLN